MATEIEYRLRAYKFRLDITNEQEGLLYRWAGAARLAYNHSVAENKKRRERYAKLRSELEAQGLSGDLLKNAMKDAVNQSKGTDEPMNYASNYSLAKEWLTPFVQHHRKSAKEGNWDPETEGFENPWAHEIFRRVFVSGLEDAEKSSKNWFASLAGTRKGRKVGAPRFKKKGRSKDSFHIPCVNDMGAKGFKGIKDYRHLFLGPLKYWRTFGHTKKMVRAIDRGAQIRSVTISRGASYWYASVLVREENRVVVPTRAQVKRGVIGVDLGVKNLATLSTGEFIPNPRHLQHSLDKLAKLQRKAAKCDKGSANQKKLYSQVAKLQHTVALKRKGYLDMVTRYLAKNWRVIAMEDLNVSGMTSSSKGTVEKPGKKVKQKSGLNRSILDASFGNFRHMMEYKTIDEGSILIFVERFAPSSKTCNSCGVVKSKLSLSEREFRCESCGHVDDRDVNAAKNIASLAMADLAELACGRRESINDCGESVSPFVALA